MTAGKRGRIRSRPRSWLRASLGALVAAFASTADGAAQSGEDVGLPVGTPAPDASVTTLDGQSVSLLELIGDGPALLNFWASWCENCEALEPQMEEIHARFGDRIAVVGVAVAVAQSLRRVRRHVERHESPYRFVYDAEGEAVRAYEALTTSIVVLVDAEGRVAATGVGPQQELVPQVEALLGVASESGSGTP